MNSSLFLVDPDTWVISLSKSAASPRVRHEITARIKSGCRPVFTLQGVNDLRDLMGIRPLCTLRPGATELKLDSEATGRLESLINLIDRIDARDLSHLLPRLQVEESVRHDKVLKRLVRGIVQARIEGSATSGDTRKEFEERLLADTWLLEAPEHNEALRRWFVYGEGNPPGADPERLPKWDGEIAEASLKLAKLGTEAHSKEAAALWTEIKKIARLIRLHYSACSYHLWTELEHLIAASESVYPVDVLSANSETRILSLYTSLPVQFITPGYGSGETASWEDLENALCSYADNLPIPDPMAAIPFEESF